MDNGSETNSILSLTQKLLDSISNRDWETYLQLVDEKMTCVEPETYNSFYEGLDLHKTYFDMPINESIKIKEIIIQPITKMYEDIAVICYKRIRQFTNMTTQVVKTETYTETRIWRRTENDVWKVVHFHKS